MKILIVDDSAEKERAIRAVVEEVMGTNMADIQVATTAARAYKCLEATTFDLMVLDLSIPMRDEQPPTPNGGVNLLRELQRRKHLQLPRHILGLTEFDELLATHQQEFTGQLWHLVRFDRSSNQWVELLRSKLIHVADSDRQDFPGRRFDFDLAIVSALHKVELEAVLELDGNWRAETPEGDNAVYHFGVFAGPEKRLRVVAAASSEMGMPAASALSMKMIYRFRPRYLGMVGIAAGVKGSFGDILVAEHSWDYGSGKSRAKGRRKKSVFLPAPTQIAMAPRLKSLFDAYSSRQDVLDEIHRGWKGHKPEKHLSARIGPMASGAAVLENKPQIDAIVKMNRKVIGVEMETYGVYMAAKTADAPAPEVFSVKSICDFGDSGKADDYQRFAAYTSANFVYRFALDCL